MPPQEHETDRDQLLRNAVKAASKRPEVLQAVAQVYEDLAGEVEARRPRCVISGRCCRFEEYGHRLYVTTAELAMFLNGFEPMVRPPPLEDSIKGWNGQGCPFQVERLCGLHALRPFGCRIYFCDATSTVWQQEAYERFHARLKTIHESFSVPYFYTEWRAALQALLPPLRPAGRSETAIPAVEE